jgi:hypothetical protein
MEMVLAFYLGGVVAMLPVMLSFRSAKGLSGVLALLLTSLAWPIMAIGAAAGLVSFSGEVEDEADTGK